MDYLLADGSRWEPGLSVASNGMAPENYWAASLMEGYLAGDEPFGTGDHYSCMVSFEKLTDENLAGAKIGRVYACRLEHLQATMQHVDYNESEFLRLLGGEMHETC